MSAMPEKEVHGRIENQVFNLAVSMDCGQVFGWHKHGLAYYGLIRRHAARLSQDGSCISFDAETGLRRSDILRYLGLEQDLDTILKSITVDPLMKKIVSRFRGLRLLRQDAWPCLCSYLLSANNRVERIDSLVKEISRRFGRTHIVKDRKVHSLPDPCDLALCPEAGIRACGAGFRSPYLLGAARMVADGVIDFEDLQRRPYEQAREILKRIPGVGDKIADCVLLFAFSKYEAFPVDVWIKRAMERIYFDSRELKPAEIRRFARDHFGRYAGYAQEYIYYYARTARGSDLSL